LYYEANGVVEALLDAGADPNAKDEEYVKTVLPVCDSVTNPLCVKTRSVVVIFSFVLCDLRTPCRILCCAFAFAPCSLALCGVRSVLPLSRLLF
jgi:hypothetical protein